MPVSLTTTVKMLLLLVIFKRDKRPLIERVREYVKMLDAEIGVNQAPLDGSTARGKRHRNIDVDIIITSESFAAMPEPKRWGLLQHMWSYKEDLETLAYTPKEFDRIKKRFPHAENSPIRQRHTPKKRQVQLNNRSDMRHYYWKAKIISKS